MTSAARLADIVIGISPFGEPDARLTSAVSRAGGLGVLDLGTGRRRAREALADTKRWAAGARFGVRVATACQLAPEDLSADEGAGPDTVVLGVDAPWQTSEVADRYRVLAEVTDLDQALDAVRSGAHGLIARGSESGGRVGELSTFVLLQLLLAEPAVAIPVWACGGIGPRTAAGAVLGGAAGVVLDTQLALLAESGLPQEATAAIRSMDGSETVVIDGHRVLRHRPGTVGGTGAATRVASRLGVHDLRTQLLPVGQDGFLASRFAERWHDTATAVRAVTEAIREAVRDGTAAAVLRLGAPMSGTLGTRLPLAQGPMTRVSDQAGFARAVADKGALPFIALALAGRDRAREVLAEAKSALAGRPWGVGLLGFAPPELRREQLEAVREQRPSHVIIAGGRPAQAEALERAGITAFLHVPSPGLLRQFLAAGARRFVLEGSECGGHVGPLGSFPLWEAQLAVIEDYLDGADGTADRVEVLFAGGIHDERSAAMVAGLSAPLVRRGGAVGLLMGTAYLFTEEAVGRGAVQPLFQRQVVAARRTVLLETAPGHATRCVASPFADGYRAIKDRLRARGVPDRQMWEELERLNVGRLRIASKGLERDTGGELLPVTEERQLREGMFMAGQVAVLRSATTTIGALHHSVSHGAAEFLTERTALLQQRLGVGQGERCAEPEAPAPLDVAVIGMACMFPQAPDLTTFWANVVGGVDAVTEVPGERWDPSIHYAPTEGGDIGGSGVTASKWGGFLPEIPFDPLRYGIPPTSLGSIEPVQMLALEAARRALDDAGYGERGRAFDRSRTAVVFGAEAGSDLSNAHTLRAVLPSYLGAVPEGLAEQLPELTEDSFPGMLANVISGRIANRLDLGGANYTVDAACASSLAAVDVACKELVGGTSDIVLCGGADLHNGINDYVLFSSVHALSPTGRSRAFDSSADGIALGEGVACVVLKRLADAQRDGDRVYGVIKGVGSSSDGRSLGLTAPRPEGQRAALERAYRNARISPADVGLIEAHGTGTVVGDRTELAILSEVFLSAGATPGRCALGSVKSQIGHTKCAAGLAGLIKTVLALHTGVKPPTLHITRPNDAWQPERSPFAFHTQARPWAAPAAERLAGLSAFGFGGTNFHVVLAAHGNGAPPAHGLDAWPAELFVFRGADRAAALREVEEALALAASNDSFGRPWRLRDLALAVARRSDTSHEPVRVAVVAEDLDNLAEQLRRVLAGERDPASRIHVAGKASEIAAFSPTPNPGKVAFLFPGQGSQRPGMFADIFVAFPELHRYLELGRAHTDVLHPPTAFDEAQRAQQRRRIADTRVAQPVLGIAGLSAHSLLTVAGIRPDMLAGHSYGELVALCAAGALDPRTLLELSAERATAILDAAGDQPGAMAAVAVGPDEAERILSQGGLAGKAVVANHNAPRQTVLSGRADVVDEVMRLFREAGHGVRRLPVACAFHSPLLAGAGERFARALARRRVRAPELPVWSNRTAAVHAADPEAVRSELAAQIEAPVRFAAQIDAMYEAGARVFVEAGPGSVLTRLVGSILGDRPHHAIAFEGSGAGGTNGLRAFLDTLAQLAVVGLPVRTGWMFRGRDAMAADRNAPPKRPGWTVDGHLVRTADGELLPGALAPARRTREVVISGTGRSEGERAERDALVREFLRGSREMVAAQRDVLLAHLGTEPGVRRTAPAAPAVVEPPPTASAVAPADAPHPEAAPTPAALTAADVSRVVSQIISERTGYPLDMIEPDLDLEADLSIDSIKRAEIAGELARRLGMRGDGAAALGDEELEELAKARTTAAVTAWLSGRLTPDDGNATPTSPEYQLPPTAEWLDDEVLRRTASVVGEAPKRLVLRAVPLGEPDNATDPTVLLTGKRFVLLGDGRGAAESVSARLMTHGAEAITVDADHLLTAQDGEVDGVILLQPLADSARPVLPGAFPVLQAALRRSPRWMLAVRSGDPLDLRAAGLQGFFRTVAKEYPGIVARVIAVPGASAPGTGGDAPVSVADALLGELLAPDLAPVVLRTAAGRHALELVETPLGSLATSGAGPAGAGAAEAAAIGLDRDSVVVLVGGARGITARFAATLASAARCRIELLGRTPEPGGPEAPATADARDPVSLRAALAAEGHRTPAEIQRETSRILAQREVASTLAELRSLGSQVRYRSVDFRETDAVLQAVKEIHAEHGRLDAAVYGAGVIEDRLIEQKTDDSFKRVFGTKVDGASALLDALEELPAGPALVVLFGSISAVLGNPGQADYAAANDALETLGLRWAARTGRRALTVHWGPWAPTGTHTGMVSLELARDYARRGVSLIDPEEGTLALLRELAWQGEPTGSVVVTASEW
ncbi:type I polyketide synthase [Streptomyces silvisoli]|uniref:SDR family NAD(P)-dependent oxidoreductase n=1 Tax=Streptomyces silvisoli TaxID=3034235 RepID=A0ABT5ZWT0_9ACTN|nr:type I polyketide synthase [Streptomyces silvisoli]MDF3294221.1 SDR family NAD(P)-dependent oxidoreductase [Streptomyces silvisoli]